MRTLSDREHDEEALGQPGTTPELNAGDGVGGQTRRLRVFVTIGLFGLLLVILGLGIDTVLHARDPNLAGEEGFFTLENPGHLMLGFGIAVATVGLAGAASALMEGGSGRSRALRIGRLSLRVGLLALVGTVVYVILGPGLGHDHGSEVADATLLSDGTRLSSGIAADVDRSRLPPEEAAALAALAWSRTGSVDVTADHDHGEAGSAAEMSSAERTTLEAQLATATATVPRYRTPAQAEAAGYVQAGPFVNGVGAHWVKWSVVDRPFDPATPSMLLYEEIRHGQGLELVGYSYWVSSTGPPEGFAGDTDVWHQHYGLCFENGWLALEDIPDRGACPGDWVNGSDLWMLHAWVVPGMDSMRGVFAAQNERLCERSCS